MFSRSRSTDEDMDGSDASSLTVEEPSLEDVAEDPESGESETATEVAVSEKTLKFKISTEGSLNTGRKSYPGSRKGSRERVQHLNTSELAKVMQKGKLRAGAFSFDQHCLTNNKKPSFDAPEFLDECAITLKKRLEEDPELQSESEDNSKEAKEDECVLSKETLNLNKRNSEHSVKATAGVEEKKSILKCTDGKSFTNADKLRMNNVQATSSEDRTIIRLQEEGEIRREQDLIDGGGKNSSVRSEVKLSSATNLSDNPNSISSDKADITGTNALSDPSATNSDTKNNRSLLSRFKQFADRFSLSMDKDIKLKNIRLNSFKNNNSQRATLPKSKKKLDSPCCKSLENFEDRKVSTLPKTKKLISGKKGWKFLILGKDKAEKDMEFWASDADVNKLSGNAELDNQSLPSTSKSQSSCTLNTSPKVETSARKTESKEAQDSSPSMKEQLQEQIAPQGDQILDNNLLNNQMSKLHEIQADQKLVVLTSENDSSLI